MDPIPGPFSHIADTSFIALLVNTLKAGLIMAWRDIFKFEYGHRYMKSGM